MKRLISWNGLFLIIMVSMALLHSCKSKVDKALELAGENQTELEKVLKHFEGTGLKYRSAEFLIENMGYNLSMVGSAVERSDSAYRLMSQYHLDERDSIYNNSAYSDDAKEAYPQLDLRSVKADYLIKMIDEACDVWEKLNWKGEFPESVFFDYVLPYRINNEMLSPWRDFAEEGFGYLHSSDVFANRGITIEGEEGMYESSQLALIGSASGGKMVVLAKEGERLGFKLEACEESRRRLFFKYSSQKVNNNVLLYVNGELKDTLCFEPTVSRGVFRENRFMIDVKLKAGENLVELGFADSPVGVDLVRVSPLEAINLDEMKDFSKTYCMISNKKTGNYITFDLKSRSLGMPLLMKPEARGDSTQLLKLDYLGFPIWKIYTASNDTADLCMEVKDELLDEGTNAVQNNFITTYQKVKINHQKWVIIPLGKDVYKIMSKDSGLYLESETDSVTGCESLVMRAYNGSDSQKWKIEQKAERNDAGTIFKWGSHISEAMKIYDIGNQFEWFQCGNGFMPRATSVLKGRTGNCREEGGFVVYLCRALGIPAAIDFTPNWGNRSQSHTWNVIVNPDGRSTPFFMGSVPGDTAHYSFSYKKPKVYRRRFQPNWDMVRDFKQSTDVPGLFHTYNIVDVPDEYYENPVDVVRPVPEEYAEQNVAYICVFDNKHWVPVGYGPVKGGKVEFKKMGPDIVYMAAMFINGRTIPFGNPFLVAGDSTITDIQASYKEKTSVTLVRKYPFTGKFDDVNYRMGGGRFQGANSADFSSATELYQFEGVTNGGWYSIPLNPAPSFTYLRYLGPDGSNGNINEMEFFDENGEKVTGTIIGTEGEEKKKKETVFDGNILTGFHALVPDGQWVGLKLSKPTHVSRLRFIARNDGNTIEPGDEYALCYWGDCQWNEVAHTVATADSLVFDDIPANALYVLHDLTKGKEERIFTYENGKQVWW